MLLCKQNVLMSQLYTGQLSMLVAQGNLVASSRCKLAESMDTAEELTLVIYKAKVTSEWDL